MVITGSATGVIDGQGSIWYKRHKMNMEGNITRPRLIEFLWSDGILLDSLTLMNSPFWTVHPTYCSNVVARELTILNPNDSPNTVRVNLFLFTCVIPRPKTYVMRNLDRMDLTRTRVSMSAW